MGNYTLTMVKPTGVKLGHAGEILKMITKDGGFRIMAMKMLTMSTNQAKEFYGIHSDKPFFGELVEFMTSGPIVAVALEKENAVEEFRNFIGATNPEKAEKGSIRNTFGVSIQENCVHGSDSDDNAKQEIKFFFSTSEIFDKEGKLINL